MRNKLFFATFCVSFILFFSFLSLLSPIVYSDSDKVTVWDSKDQEFVTYRDSGGAIEYRSQGTDNEWRSTGRNLDSLDDVIDDERFFPEGLTLFPGYYEFGGIGGLDDREFVSSYGEETGDGFILLPTGDYYELNENGEITLPRLSATEYETEIAKRQMEEDGPRGLSANQINLLLKDNPGLYGPGQENDLTNDMIRRRYLDSSFAAGVSDWSEGLRTLGELFGWGWVGDSAERRQKYLSHLRDKIEDGMEFWEGFFGYGEDYLVQSCAMGQTLDFVKFFENLNLENIDYRGIDHDSAVYCPTRACVRVELEYIDLGENYDGDRYLYILSLLVVPPKDEEWKYEIALRGDGVSKDSAIEGHVGIEDNKADQYVARNAYPFSNENKFTTLVMEFTKGSPRDYIGGFGGGSGNNILERTVRAADDNIDPSNPPSGWGDGSSGSGTNFNI